MENAIFAAVHDATLLPHSVGLVCLSILVFQLPCLLTDFRITRLDEYLQRICPRQNVVCETVQNAMTNKFAVFVLFVSGIPLLVGGCGHKQQSSTPAWTTAETPAANAPVQGPTQAPNADQTPTPANSTADNPTPNAAAQTPGAPLDSSIATASASPNDSANKPSDSASGDAPIVNVGLTVDQAYAAFPHERMVWVAGDSTNPSSDQPYLGAIFRVLDEAIAVKVAGLQHYSRGDFDSLDIEALWRKHVPASSLEEKSLFAVADEIRQHLSKRRVKVDVAIPGIGFQRVFGASLLGPLPPV